MAALAIYEYQQEIARLQAEVARLRAELDNLARIYQGRDRYEA